MVVTAPMGARGERPVQYWCEPHDAKSIARYVPGTEAFAGGVRCTWDVAPIVARMLKREEPEVPGHLTELPPGVTAYQQLFGDAPRDYQKPAARYLAARHWALLCDPMRVGKTLEFLMAAVLVASQRTLIVCPSVVKGVWAREIGRWCKEPALVLQGLGCSLAHRYCLTCAGRGRIRATGEWCPDCRARNGSSYGYTIFDVRSTEEPTKRQLAEYGNSVWRCRKHPEVVSAVGRPEKCIACKRELQQAIFDAKYIVINYDLLTPRGSKDKTGRSYMDPAMRGWLKLLQAVPFELCGLDEIHHLRGFSTSGRQRGKMLSDRMEEMLAHVPTVWGITGTPIYGHVRDLLPVLNVISGGLFRGTDRRPWFKTFHIRYCGGTEGEWGWTSTGRSNEDELIERLSHIKIQRSRPELLPNLPPKTRRIEVVEAPDYKMRTRLNGTPKGTIMKLVTDVAKYKFEAVIENVINEMAEGYKTYVLVYHRKTCERLGREIGKVMQSKANKVRMRSTNATLWVAQTVAGISSAPRARMAEKFVEHEGAGCFVATIDSMPGGLSLAGALFVHIVDFHHSPSAIEQAEDRPNEVGISQGLVITHYSVPGSVDDHLEAQLMPKFEHKDRLLNDPNAHEVLSTFGHAEEQETIDAVWARLTAHIDEGIDDDDD